MRKLLALGLIVFSILAISSVGIVAEEDPADEKGWLAISYINHNDGTVTDNLLGLMWVAHPASAGFSEPLGWATASAKVSKLDYAGYTDWRLPNIKELGSLIDFGIYNPAIDTDYFTCESANYWSSTISAEYPGNIWSVYFGNGFINQEPAGAMGYVRPVRSR